MENRVLVIAEAGVNHNGDVELAKQLIDVAANAKADIVKFQSFRTCQLTTKSAPKARYQKETIDSQESQYDMLRQLEFGKDIYKELIEYCAFQEIEFLSTGFDIDSVTMLADLRQSRFKIPSGEITNLPLLRHVGHYGKPTILSTGMSDMREVANAVEILEQSGTPKHSITVLHCTTEYPAPIDEVNLRAMQTIAKNLVVAVGYSDHTLGIEVPAAAVALGAVVIEKHFTLSRNMTGPDHQASLEPDELKEMVSVIRNIERALGDGIKRPTPSELRNKGVGRKSIVAARSIISGEVLTTDNITVKRPGLGVSPMFWDRLVGSTATRNYDLDEFIDPPELKN